MVTFKLNKLNMNSPESQIVWLIFIAKTLLPQLEGKQEFYFY